MNAELFALVDGLGRCPGPRLVARDGVVLRDMSQVECDNRDTLDFDAIEARASRDPEFLAALLSRIERLGPPPLSSVPFNSTTSVTATALFASPSPGPSPDSILFPNSDLIASFLEYLTFHRDLTLFWVTLTSPTDPRKHLGELLATCPGAWGVLEARRDRSLHAHGFVLLPSRQAVRTLLARWCALSPGAKEHAQHCKQVTGWKAYAVRHDSSALVENLARILAYAGKGVVDAFALGALAHVPVLSRSAHVSATVTASPALACLCGCGETCTGRSKYAAPQATHRQRYKRRKKPPVTVPGDGGATVTASPVTPKRDTAPTVTGKAPTEEGDAWLDA